MDFKLLKTHWELWLIYGSAFVLFIWVILKIFGVINTPMLLQSIPYLTGISALLGFGIAVGKLLQRMNFFGLELGEVKETVSVLQKDVQKLDGSVNGLERDMRFVKQKVTHLESDVHSLEKDAGIIKAKLSLA